LECATIPQDLLFIESLMKIAFLEDDLTFASELVAAIQLEDIEVDHFSSGRECLKALNLQRYDLALLDWEVPDMSGTEVLASLKIKGNCPPVIFLTGRDAEEDVISVIESGADDYIVKPPSVKVLIARINALYRRANSNLNVVATADYGSLTIYFTKRKFEIDHAQVKLTEKETDLALYFFSQVGTLLSRAHLTKVVWGSTPDLDTRTIDVHVSHLRSKLKLLPQFGWRLVSVYHQGYRLERLESD
jgi:two-component system, OmpR family, response regulator RegX3